MKVSYKEKQFSSYDENSIPSLLVKDSVTGDTVAVSDADPIPTVASPGTATPTSLISKFSRFIGWAMFNATPSTRTEGQAGPLQSDANGNLNSNLGTKLAGEDLVRDRMMSEYAGNWTYISTATTTTVNTGPCHLKKIVFLGGTAGTVTVYDNTSATGSNFVIPSGITAGTPVEIDAKFFIGLTIVTAAATNILVVKS